MLDLYEHDTAGQEGRTKLVALQTELRMARVQFDLFEKVYLGIDAYVPPNSPPPPESPPAGVNAPPASPRGMSTQLRYQQLEKRVEDLQIQTNAQAASIGICVPSATNICGRSSQQAPNPWMSATGEQCAGYGTWEALEGTFCAYWGGQVCQTQQPS